MFPQKYDNCSSFNILIFQGRIGTTIGNTKLENFDEKLDALRQFEALYEEKTGNRWSKRDEFKKGLNCEINDIFRNEETAIFFSQKHLLHFVITLICNYYKISEASKIDNFKN